jgi:hypothetical protein
MFLVKEAVESIMNNTPENFNNALQESGEVMDQSVRDFFK